MQKASNAKNQYADWNIELQQKLKELREEKKSWTLEAAALRSHEKEMQVRFLIRIIHRIYDLYPYRHVSLPKESCWLKQRRRCSSFRRNARRINTKSIV